MSARYPGWEWWVWSTLVILTAILSIIAITKTNTFNGVRCFQATGPGVLPTPPVGGYTGYVEGCVQFGVSSLQVNLKFWMPMLQGIPSAIVIRGPLTNSGVGNLPLATAALTICGSTNTNTCPALEGTTCDQYGLSAGCGRLEVSVKSLAPTDIALTSQVPDILGFLDQARNSPQLFYISIEHASVETARGPLLQIGTVN